MNATQARIAAQMLELAADEFGNHGCNDFSLPLTDENLRFAEWMIAAGDYPDDEPLIYEGEIVTSDYMVMRYCARLLLDYAENVAAVYYK